VKISFGWLDVWADTIWVYLYYIYYASLLMIFLYLLLDFWKKTKRAYEKKQARIIFITSLISLIFGSMTDVIFPQLKFNLPSTSSIIILVWAVGIAYGITKYKLMTVTAALASAEIIGTMPDTLFLILPDTSIVDINNAACELTGYSREELIGKPVETLLEEGTSLFKGAELENLLKDETVRDYSMSYRTKSGVSIPVSFSGSVVHDREGNTIGIVVIGRDMREMLKIQQRENELSAEKERTKALEETRSELEKTVEVQTAELKKSCDELSEKTKTLERFQKITIGRELEMIKIKDEIDNMLERLGQPRKYMSSDKI
jgi:PAS domain S-box-containing protein